MPQPVWVCAPLQDTDTFKELPQEEQLQEEKPEDEQPEDQSSKEQKGQTDEEEVAC